MLPLTLTCPERAAEVAWLRDLVCLIAHSHVSTRTSCPLAKARGGTGVGGASGWVMGLSVLTRAGRRVGAPWQVRVAISFGSLVNGDRVQVLPRGNTHQFRYQSSGLSHGGAAMVGFPPQSHDGQSVLWPQGLEVNASDNVGARQDQ